MARGNPREAATVAASSSPFSGTMRPAQPSSEVAVIAIQIKPVGNDHRRLDQIEVAGLGTAVKGKPPLLPAGDPGHAIRHSTVDGTHAHQVEQGRGQVGGQPERQPVVAQIQNQIESRLLRQGPIPEPGQKPVGLHLHRCIKGAVLGAGLGCTLHQPETGPGAGGRQVGSSRRQHRQVMAPLDQAGHQRFQGDLNPATGTGAEGPHRGGDHQELQGAAQGSPRAGAQS